MYVCPYCGREYSKRSYFAKHMKEKHGVEKPFAEISSLSSPETETLEIEASPEKKVRVPPERKVEKEKKKEVRKMEYECGNCGYKFDRKIKFCPNCGAKFDWSKVEEEEE